MQGRTLRCYSSRDERIRLDFFPCRNTGPDMTREEWHLADTEFLTVYNTDCARLLLPFIVKVFPLTDPTDGAIQKNFDPCLGNWIGANAWTRIAASMCSTLTHNEKRREQAFYADFLIWILQQLEWADIIVAKGKQ